MKQNISSQFKYTMELGVEATKSTFKIKKSKKDKITHILVIVFIFAMSGLLIWDILKGNSFVVDIIILAALIGVEIFSLIMPIIIINTQKKFLKQLNLAEIEYTITEISKDKCTESYYKNNKIVMQNVCDITKLIGYQIKDDYVFIVFDNFACAILDLKTINLEQNELCEFLDTTISKNKLLKK